MSIYRSDFWPSTPLIRTRNCDMKGKQCHKQKRWLYLFHCMRAPKGCGRIVSVPIFLSFFSGWGEAIPLLHQGRSATTALTKWTKCFRCKEGFSAVFIFFGLTLHCLLLDTLTLKLKLKENSLNVILSEQVHLNGLDRKTISILKRQSKISCHLKK